MVYKIFLLIAATSVLIFFVAYIILLAFRPSPTEVFYCVCDIPEYGVKEAIVTVQIEGENWTANVLYPTDITLNIFGYSVPCSCRTV